MDNYPEVEHTPECDWIRRKVKRTAKWWKFMALKNCPTCNGKVTL